MPDSPTPADLDRWQALCDAATEGPWTHFNEYPSFCSDVSHKVWGQEGPGFGMICDTSPYSAAGFQRVNDAALIAESRTALPACIAEIRRLRVLLKACRDTLSDDDSIRPEFLARIDEALRGAAP